MKIALSKLKNKILNNQGYIVIGAIVIIGIVCTYRSCTVKKEGVYTIATVYNIKGARSGFSLDFEYSFKDKVYKSYGNSSYILPSDEGGRFFIQVLESDPSRCFMTKVPVPSYIEEAPSDGWEELPVPHD